MRIPDHRLLSRPIVQMGLAGPLIFCILFQVSSANGQWRHLIDQQWNHSFVYFIPTAPEIGFLIGHDPPLRTTDGGWTWRRCNISESGANGNQFGNVTEWTFAFKDSMTGWLLTGGQASVFKTTDQGETWALISQLPYNVLGQISYNLKRDALFINGPQSFESTDEGITWNTIFWKRDLVGYGKLGFWNDSTGIFPGGASFDPPEVQLAERTTDAGITWQPVLWDSNTASIVALSGTATAFCLTAYGNVLRTDNFWDSNWVVYRFPQQPYPAGPSGTADAYGYGVDPELFGDSTELFAHLSSGCYRSIDSGASWQYLCGMPSIYSPVWYSGFYAAGHSVYVVTVSRIVIDTPSATYSSLWYLNLDSMQYFPTGTGIYGINGMTKDTTITPGTPVTIQYFPKTSDPIGVDTGVLVFRYDSDALDIKNIQLQQGWRLVSENSHNGILTLQILADSSEAIANPMVSLTFNTYLSPSSETTTHIYLDSTYLSGKRLNCDCQALSTGASDSVTIRFTGCGDSLLEAGMNHEPPFTIESVVPNPAPASLRVEGKGQRLEATLFDALGKEVISSTPASLPFTLDVSQLPSGIYFLRISSGGCAVSRSVSIGR